MTDKGSNASLFFSAIKTMLITEVMPKMFGVGVAFIVIGLALIILDRLG